MANLIVVVNESHNSVVGGCFGWGGRSLYVAEHFMAELKLARDATNVLTFHVYQRRVAFPK
jgi:hypothetical protein